MKHTSLADLPCPVARSLDVIGEWWTLLIIRDAFLGARRFDDFKATGIADNILAARLRRLCAEGLLERERYQTRPDRYEYLLTEKGRALGPVLAALRHWGKEWTTGPDSSLHLVHTRCGHELGMGILCPKCGVAISPEEIRAEPVDPGAIGSSPTTDLSVAPKG
jgi:DNA-binding HxlR family transcriptional regulator